MAATASPTARSAAPAGSATAARAGRVIAAGEQEGGDHRHHDHAEYGCEGDEAGDRDAHWLLSWYRRPGRTYTQQLVKGCAEAVVAHCHAGAAGLGEAKR